MEIIEGLNFHKHTLDWYLRNEMNERMYEFLTDELNEPTALMDKDGNWFSIEIDAKHVFDDAYELCTRICNDKCIRNKFWSRYGLIHENASFDIFEFLYCDQRLTFNAYVSWFSYLMLYYESQFEEKIPKNVEYYFRMCDKTSIYQNSTFLKLKDIVDRYIEEQKAILADGGKRMCYDFSIHMYTAWGYSLPSWIKWTNNFDIDRIHYILDMYDNEADAQNAMRDIEASWKEYENSGVDRTIGNHYASQRFFDDFFGRKKYDIEELAEAYSTYDAEYNKNVSEHDNDIDSSVPVINNNIENKDEDKELRQELYPIFTKEEYINEYIEEIKGKSDKTITKITNKYIEDKKIYEEERKRNLYNILHDHNIYTKSESNWNSQIK